MTTKNRSLSLLSRLEVAEVFNISTRTVARWEEKGLLKPIRITSRLIRYQKRDIDALIEETKVEMG